MPGIIAELTNHCNMNCKHCLDERHSADGYLSLDNLKIVLQNAKMFGFTDISLTGGEPTLHPEFIEILERTSSLGYEVGFVTNAWNFVDLYRRSHETLSKVDIITFSLDGANDSTHDNLRRAGSFRRVLQAISICAVKNIPFSINSVITAQNYIEIEDIVKLAFELGSRGVRFGFLMPTELSLSANLVLSRSGLKNIQDEVTEFQNKYKMPVILAPGFFSKNLFPCAPLQHEEFNIDWKGNITLCCHISGYGNGSSLKDVIGNLNEISFSKAIGNFKKLVLQFRKTKNDHHNTKQFLDEHYFPCLYCLNYFEKATERLIN